MIEKDTENRINEFIEALINVAGGDYFVQVELSEKNDYLDALGIGINMMVDDIRKSHETALENDRITLLNAQLLEAKAKAEQSDRLKSAFLANMSHEIRTPMNGILGFANILKDPFLSHDDQIKYIGILEKSGNRLLNIINDLIDISKIESGQIKVNISETNIYEQAEYIYNFFLPEAESKGLKLCFRNIMPKEFVLKTDREKLYAILTNLVKNAIKYSEKGTIEIGYSRNADFIEFYVKDTGIGIPEDKHALIFDRFIQTNDTSSRSCEGVGLGLAICKAYVEMLGGKLWLESKEEEGSVFYFTIPYILKTDEPVLIQDIRLKPMEICRVNTLKVLIVEDDAASEMLLAIALKKFSKETIIVRNGIDAVDTLRKYKDIDLIMMDFMLPGLNGYEATRQIRQFNKDVLIIAQTACGFLEDRDKAMEAGCDDYISKPIDNSELNEIITRHFQIISD
jgi:hypothetical protein